MLLVVPIIIQLVSGVLNTRNNVVQNRRKSERLIECLEAILPPLRTIEDAESKNPMAHRETLEKLKKVVEDAKELLEKQGKNRPLSKYLSSSSVKEQFNDITQRLQTHMQALNLSVAVLDANTMEADDAADRQELLEIFMSGHDQVRRDMSNLGDRLGGIILDGQDQHAREFLAGQEQLAEELRQLKIAMERPPAPRASNSLPHIDWDELMPIEGDGNKMLGHGGFGKVTKMHWVTGDMDVAVKELHDHQPSDEALAELRREAEAMYKMSHPNIL